MAANSITDIVNSLEPDLAAAYLAGNPVVIQAVAAGATTTRQVVDAMILSGTTLGLPPGVQELVSTRLKEAKGLAADGNGVAPKAAAEQLTSDLLVTNMVVSDRAGLGQFECSVGKPPSSAEFKHMSWAQKEAYRDAIMATTAQEWKDAPPAVRAQNIENVTQDAQDARQVVGLTQADLMTRMLKDPNLGGTLKEHMDAMKVIQQSVDKWMDRNPDKTLKDYADDLGCTMHHMNDAQMSYAVQLLAIKKSSNAAELGAAQAKLAAEAEERKDHGSSLGHAQSTVTEVRRSAYTLSESQQVIQNAVFLDPAKVGRTLATQTPNISMQRLVAGDGTSGAFNERAAVPQIDDKHPVIVMPANKFADGVVVTAPAAPAAAARVSLERGVAAPAPTPPNT